MNQASALTVKQRYDTEVLTGIIKSLADHYETQEHSHSALPIQKEYQDELRKLNLTYLLKKRKSNPDKQIVIDFCVELIIAMESLGEVHVSALELTEEQLSFLRR